jgi:hypothetical protein
MQKELVMVYAVDRWDDVYNVDSSSVYELRSDEEVLTYVKLKYNKRFKGCEFVIEKDELYAICPDDLDLPMINPGEVLKGESQ